MKDELISYNPITTFSAIAGIKFRAQYLFQLVNYFALCTIGGHRCLLINHPGINKYHNDELVNCFGSKRFRLCIERFIHLRFPDIKYNFIVYYWDGICSYAERDRRTETDPYKKMFDLIKDYSNNKTELFKQACENYPDLFKTRVMITTPNIWENTFKLSKYFNGEGYDSASEFDLPVDHEDFLETFKAEQYNAPTRDVTFQKYLYPLQFHLPAYFPWWGISNGVQSLTSFPSPFKIDMDVCDKSNIGGFTYTYNNVYMWHRLNKLLRKRVNITEPDFFQINSLKQLPETIMYK